MDGAHCVCAIVNRQGHVFIMTAVLSDDPGDGIMQSDARTGHNLSHYAEIWPLVSIYPLELETKVHPSPS